MFTFIKTCELCFLLLTTVNVWLKTWFHSLKIKRKKPQWSWPLNRICMFWAVLSKIYSCLWTPSLIIICQFFECVQCIFFVTNKWYYIDISIKINNISKLWKEIVPYCNEFYLARLGMQFKTNINYSKRERNRDLLQKWKKEKHILSIHSSAWFL